MKRYTLFLAAAAIAAALLPGCRRNKPEPTTRPTTMPTTAATTAPTTAPTTMPTTRRTEQETVPSSDGAGLPEDETGATGGNETEGQRRIMPRGTH